MHRPVLVTAPAATPVTLAEAKVHLRVNAEDGEGQLLPNEDDALIEGLLKAATEHLDGWTGILGRCLEEQEWRQDYDRFHHCLPLPLYPVISVTIVTWRDVAGQESTVDSSDYSMATEADGRSFVRFKSSFSVPSDLDETVAVSVTYRAGYQPAGGNSTVPEPIKQAIKLIVGAWYENREQTVIGTITSSLPTNVSIDALLASFRPLRF